MEKRGTDPVRGNRDENWYFANGEYCYAPPTWIYTDAQLELMNVMGKRKMPARVSDEILAGRRLEKLSAKECKELITESEFRYETEGLEWYRETQER